MKEQLDRAYSLLRDGQSAEALLLLENLIREDPENEDAWWIYANGVTETEAKKNALHHVLRLSQNAERLSKAKSMLQGHEQDPYNFEKPAPNPARPLKADNGFGRFILMGIGALGLFACIGCTFFYNLRLSFTEMPETFVDMGELSIGDALEGNLEADDSHAYELNLEAGQAVRIVVQPREANESLFTISLYDSERNLVGAMNETALGLSAMTVEIPETGDYILIVRPFLGLGGEYTVTIELAEAE